MTLAATGITIDEVAAEDVPEVIALITRVLAEHDLVFGDGSATDLQLSGLPGAYREVGGRFWVARDAAGILGTAGLYPLCDTQAELRKMYLDARARGLGVGKRLLDAVVDFARETHVREIVLDTTEQMGRAIAFYERHGFIRDDAQIRGARCSRGYRLTL